MELTNAQSLLAQVKMLEARAASLAGAAEAGIATNAGAPTQRPAFADLLADSINGVNETMSEAGAKSDAFLRQEPGADLVDTMLAVNKAQVSFRAVVEVRNQLVQAYKDIASMPI